MAGKARLTLSNVKFSPRLKKSGIPCEQMVLVYLFRR